MSKKLRVLLIVSIGLALLGIILILVGAALKAEMSIRIRKDTGIETNLDIFDEKQEISQEFSNIQVNLGCGDIVIKKGQKAEVEIFHYDTQYVPTCAVQGNTLVVSDESENAGIYNWLNIDLSFQFEKNTVVIYVPEDISLQTIEINNENGSVKIEDMEAEKINTYVKSGKISIDVNTEEKNVDFHGETTFGLMNIDGKLSGMAYNSENKEVPYIYKIKVGLGSVDVNFDK